MAERPVFVEGGGLRTGVRFRSVLPVKTCHRASAVTMLDDWQSEIAQELPVGLMFDAVDTDAFENGQFVGVDRVLKIVTVP